MRLKKFSLKSGIHILYSNRLISNAPINSSYKNFLHREYVSKYFHIFPFVTYMFLIVFVPRKICPLNNCRKM